MDQEVDRLRRRLRKLIDDEMSRLAGDGPVDLDILKRALTKALQKISYTPLTIKITPVDLVTGQATIEVEVPNPNLN